MYLEVGPVIRVFIDVETTVVALATTISPTVCTTAMCSSTS